MGPVRVVCWDEHVPGELQHWIVDCVEAARKAKLEPDFFVYELHGDSWWWKLWERGDTPEVAVDRMFSGEEPSPLNFDHPPNGFGDIAFRRGQRFATNEMPLGFSFCPHTDKSKRATWLKSYAFEFLKESCVAYQIDSATA